MLKLKKKGDSTKPASSDSNAKTEDMSSSSAAPTPKKNASSAEPCIAKKKAVLKPNANLCLKSKKAKDSDAVSTPGSDPLSGKELFFESRKSTIMKANAEHPDVEMLALLKCEEEWKQMSLDERCPWEEKAEKNAEHANQESTAKNAASEVSKKRKTPTNESKESNPKKGKSEASTPKDAPKPPKKPKSAWMLFCDAKREQVKQDNPGISFADSGKALSKMWKDVSEEDKKPFESEASKLVAEYKLIKDEYDKAGAGGESGCGKDGKQNSGKAKKDPNAPKKPKTAFLLFCDAKREDVKASNPTITPTEVMKEIGKLWQAATAEEKTPFEDTAMGLLGEYKKDKAKYDEDKPPETTASTGKKRKRTDDKPKEKKPKTAWMLFQEDARPKIRAEHPDLKFAEISTMLGQQWKALSAEEKKGWDERAAKEKMTMDAQGTLDATESPEDAKEDARGASETSSEGANKDAECDANEEDDGDSGVVDDEESDKEDEEQSDEKD